jgi:hypothetical protein
MNPAKPLTASEATWPAVVSDAPVVRCGAGKELVREAARELLHE